MIKEDNLVEVSVVMCTYNGEKFLIKQLESILNQNYSNLTEVICVDDGSTDATLHILQDYAKNDKRIKIYINETNLGYIKNYEKAFTLTTKPYIAIADQDDIWFPNKISLLMSTIKNNMMVYSDNLYIDSEDNSTGKQFSHCRYLRECTSCLNFVMANGISGHTALIDRKLLSMLCRLIKKFLTIIGWRFTQYNMEKFHMSMSLWLVTDSMTITRLGLWGLVRKRKKKGMNGKTKSLKWMT